MSIIRKQTTIAYRCPDCGCIVRSVVGVFSLSADMIKLKCPCGASALDIVYTHDKKVRITVPCIVCPAPHTYVISGDVFFEREAFTLACTYSGLGVCFIGSEYGVDNEIRMSEEELIEIAGEDALRQFSENRGEGESLTDPQVLDIIMYTLKELEDEGNIHCRCENGGDYELQLGDEDIFVVCKKCGAEYAVRAGSLTAAQDFLNADSITLT